MWRRGCRDDAFGEEGQFDGGIGHQVPLGKYQGGGLDLHQDFRAFLSILEVSWGPGLVISDFLHLA